MDLTYEEIKGLNFALNEATLLGVDVDVHHRKATVALSVFTLMEGAVSDVAPVSLELFPICRVAASLRHGIWNDALAPVEPLTVEQLSAVVRSFRGIEPIYGANFFDVPEDEDFSRWSDRVSVDAILEAGDCAHTLDLFQEGSSPDRHLDIRLWFDDLRILGAAETEISLQDFIDGGMRWWAAH